MRMRFEHGWLGGSDFANDVVVDVDDEVITSVVPGGPGPFDREIKGVVLPGLVSAHSHAFHRALRGRTHAGSGDFWAWRKPMYELAQRLTPSMYEEMAVLVFTEMLLSGITSVGEFHYVHHQLDATSYEDPNAMGVALINAARRTGVRLTLIDALYLLSDVNGSPPLPEQRRFSDGSVTEWEDRVRALAAQVDAVSGVRLGVAAHSVRAVSPSDIGHVARLAADLECPLHVHVSEQTAENDASQELYGVTPVRLLDRAGFLGPGTTLVHATHVTAGDVDLIGASGSTVCFCPTTEADLGDGIGPAAEYRLAGVPFALGTDSNAMIDLFEEMRRVEHHDRLRLHRRGVHSAESLLISGSRVGANSLGWPDTGIIEPGYRGDLVVVDTKGLDLAGSKPNSSAIVMGNTRASVTDVFVGGEQLVSDRRPVRMNLNDFSAAWDRLMP